MASFVSGGGGGKNKIVENAVANKGIGYIETGDTIIDGVTITTSDWETNIAKLADVTSSITLVDGQEYKVTINGNSFIAKANKNNQSNEIAIIGINQNFLIYQLSSPAAICVKCETLPSENITVTVEECNTINIIDRSLVNNGIFIAKPNFTSYQDLYNAICDRKIILVDATPYTSTAPGYGWVYIITTTMFGTYTDTTTSETYSTITLEDVFGYQGICYGSNNGETYWYENYSNYKFTSRADFIYHGIPVFECSTAANVANKQISYAGTNGLIPGETFGIRFTYGNTAANPTLYIDSANIPIVCAISTTEFSSDLQYNTWGAGEVIIFRKNNNQLVHSPSGLMVANKLDKSGGTMTGALTLSGAPTANLHAATKKYVDDSVANVDALPSQSGNSGKFLTTNGTSASWADTPTELFECTYGVTTYSEIAIIMNKKLPYLLKSSNGIRKCYIYSGGEYSDWSYHYFDNVSNGVLRRIVCDDMNNWSEETAITVVPTTRTVNSKALSSNITLTASDVGALPSSTTIPAQISKIYTGTCDTAASAAAKTVTLDDSTGYSLAAGVRVAVTFQYGNSATTPTLNVNGGGAKNIVIPSSATAYTSGSGTTYNTWGAYETLIFTYTGSYWVHGPSGRLSNLLLPKSSTGGGGAYGVSLSVNSSTAGNVSDGYFNIYAWSDGNDTNTFQVDSTSTTIHKVVTPTADGDAANKKYVDDAIAGVDALPSQSGQSGKFLTTNGTAASWGTVSVPKVYFGTCSTATSTAEKSVTCSGFVLENGATINVYFDNANSADSPTLNVNSTGAKSIKKDGTYVMPKYGWLAGQTVTFTFVGDTSSGYWTVVGVNTYVTAGQKSGTTIGSYATAEGQNTTASGVASHAEGSATTASNLGAHAEGYQTVASGSDAHAEGDQTTASAYTAHSEGYGTTASGYHSHAEGLGTTAQRRSQHVFGEYNVLDTSGTSDTRGSYIEIVGKGTGNGSRSNARTLDWSGNEVLAGSLTVGSAPTSSNVARNITVSTSEPTSSDGANGDIWFVYEE